MNSEQIAAYYRDNRLARWLALASISLAIFVTLVTFSAVNLAIPVIARELRAEAVLVGWLPTSFLLSNAIFLLPAGRLADIHGRKRVFVIGIVIYSLACVLAALAGSIGWLLAIRFAQGIGTAMIGATSTALVVSVFASGNRGAALGTTSAALYLGIACGPLVGGWFTEHFGWRSVFVSQLPLTLLSLLLIVTRLKGEWTSGDSRRVDWLGAAIFAVWAGAFFAGVSLLPHPAAAAVLLLAVGALAAFVIQQSHSPDPLLRLRAIWSNRLYSRSLIASICLYTANYPLIFLLSLYLQFNRGLSPSDAGLVMILQAVMMALVSPISGRLSDRYAPRIIATAGCLVVTGAFALLMQVGNDTPIEGVGVALLMLGVGFGMFATPNNNAALGAVPPAKLSIASATLNLSRVTGNMLGTAIVLLLMSVIVGNVQIDPDRYPALLEVIRWSMRISCGCALLGAWFSFARGEARVA